MKRRWWLIACGLGWLWPAELFANQRGTKRNYYHDLFAFTKEVIEAADVFAKRQLAAVEWGDVQQGQQREAELNRQAGELRTLISEWRDATQPR